MFVWHLVLLRLAAILVFSILSLKFLRMFFLVLALNSSKKRICFCLLSWKLQKVCRRLVVIARYLLRIAEVDVTCLVGAFLADNFNVFTNIVGAVLIPLVGCVCPLFCICSLWCQKYVDFCDYPRRGICCARFWLPRSCS